MKRSLTNRCIFLVMIFIVISTIACKKIKEYEYVEDYEGGFNFTVYETYLNTHPTDGGEVYDTSYYYGDVVKLRRDEILITYSSEIPSVTLCYDREYAYFYALNVYVDKSGRLELPCTDYIQLEKFTGSFIGFDTLSIEIVTRLSEFTTLGHKILGVR